MAPALPVGFMRWLLLESRCMQWVAIAAMCHVPYLF
jgi:hypothetical protein